MIARSVSEDPLEKMFGLPGVTFVLFSDVTLGKGLWLRAIAAHDSPTPRTDPSRRTVSLLGKHGIKAGT